MGDASTSSPYDQTRADASAACHGWPQ